MVTVSNEEGIARFSFSTMLLQGRKASATSDDVRNRVQYLSTCTGGVDLVTAVILFPTLRDLLF